VTVFELVTGLLPAASVPLNVYVVLAVRALVVVEPLVGSAVLLYCPPLKVVLIQLLDVQLKAAVALYATELEAVNEGTQAGGGFTVTLAEAVTGLLPETSVPLNMYVVLAVSGLVVVEPLVGSAVLLYCPPLKAVLIQLVDIQLKAAVEL